MDSNSKVVLYIGGGVMAGVFGAGVVTAFQKENFYRNIDAVYGSSGGALTAAYFLAGQSELGSSIFYDDLINEFIKPNYILLGIYDRFRNKFICHLPVSQIRNPINIDYVFDIISTKKKLDVATIRDRDISLFVHVLNTKSLQSEFIDVLKSDDPLQILKAGISAVPYYFPSDGQYIDGEIVNPFPITEIVNQRPGQHIVAVLNIIPDKLMKTYRDGQEAGQIFLKSFVSRP